MANKTKAQRKAQVETQRAEKDATGAPTLAAVIAGAQPTPEQAAAKQAKVVESVALRGGAPVAMVSLGKPYRVQTERNKAWFDAIQAKIAAGGGSAKVADLLRDTDMTQVMLTYLLRRGNLIAATKPE